MFLAYRLLIAEAGLERFGVWSLLLAATTFARIGDLSGGGALARFVASASRSSRREIIHTVLLTSLVFNGVLGLILWFALPRALPLFVPVQFISEASALIPFVIGSLVIGALATGVVSGIDGAQRADQRALVVSAASLVFFIACWLLIPHFGLLGVGGAQVLQQVATLVLGWIVLRRHVTDAGWLPYSWRAHVFRETTAYALRLNAIGVMGLMFEPLAKFAFNNVGGPGLVALYELASRLIVQMRGLVIAGATPLVPAFAAKPGPHDPAFRQMLDKSSRVAVFAAVGTAILILIAAPIMSVVVLGHFSAELLSINAILTAGWTINLLIVPIYFAAQGVGVLRWNFASHAVIAIAMLIGVLIFSPVVGPAAPLASIVAGLFLSTLTILLGNARAFDAMDIMWGLRWHLLGASASIILLCTAASLPVPLLGLQ